MKRILLIITIIAIIFALCSCGVGKGPSAAEMKKLIPQNVEIDLAEYSLLNEAPPSVDEILGDTPRTFVFDESKWTPTTESEYEEYGYEVYSGTDGTKLLHNPDYNTYEVYRGTMNPDTSVSDDFLWIQYDEHQALYAYSNNKYACYIVSQSTSHYEGDDLIETESFTFFDIEVRDGNHSYRYSIDPHTEKIEQIQVEHINIDDPDRYDYFSFCYYPGSKEIDYISRNVSTRKGNYMCEYDIDGKLSTVTYYPNDYTSICYIYNGNYKLINTEKLN